MARMSRRALPPALLAIAALLAFAAPAAAFRDLTHADPVRVFKKYAHARGPLAHLSAADPFFQGDWPCTTQPTSDLPPVLSSNAPQVKVIYAYPAGATDNLAATGPLMQADAKAVRDRLVTPVTGEAPGSTKTVRFDTGGTGGPCSGNEKHYLDIETVLLDHNASFYNPPNPTFQRLTAELKAKLAPPAPGARVNYVVYADGIQASGASGQADILIDDEKSLESPINQGQTGDGRLFAVVYGVPGKSFTDSGAPSTGAREATFLHELSHTLGAVQDSAPNSTGAGHCTDEADIMCYVDSSGMPTHSACSPALTTPFDELYDCNNDDYWNPSPSPGNYLATHWNAYDSVFLCDVSNCDSALTPPSGASVSVTRSGGRLSLAGSVASGTIAHYEWDIDGDGFYDVDTGTTPSITPTWDSPGARTVHMRASAADGTFAIAGVSVTPTTPTPHFGISGQFVAGQTLQLDGSATSDPDGLITNFVWDLDGDKVYETDTGLTRTASTAFSVPGSYSVGLEVDYPSGTSWARTGNFYIAPAASGGGGGTGTLPPGGASGGTIQVAGPSVALVKVRIRQLIARGLPLTVTCGGQCAVSFTLAVDAKTAKKLRLHGRAGKPVKIGWLTGIYALGKTKPLLTLTPAAKKAVKKARSLTVQVTGKVTQGTLTPLRIAKSLTLKH
jgi:PKD domain-containing protein